MAVSMDAESIAWVRDLRSAGPTRDRAAGRLRELLLRVAHAEAARRRAQLPGQVLSELDDLCDQAATDAAMGFLASRRTGFYLAVVHEGTVEAGDPVELIERDRHGVMVADITRLYAFDKNNRALLDRAVQVAALPESWRTTFEIGSSVSKPSRRL